MSNATLVTIDRVIAILAGQGIEATDDPSGRAGHANVDGYNLLFVLLDSVLIVRADAVTDTADPAEESDTDIPTDTPTDTTPGAGAGSSDGDKS